MRLGMSACAQKQLDARRRTYAGAPPEAPVQRDSTRSTTPAATRSTGVEGLVADDQIDQPLEERRERPGDALSLRMRVAVIRATRSGERPMNACGIMHTSIRNPSPPTIE